MKYSEMTPELNEITKNILDSYPYAIVFVDTNYIIRFMNRFAEYHYYTERGYKNLIGKNLFDCHDTDAAKKRIMAGFEKMKSDGKEMFVGISARNLRIYMQPVRNEDGELIGFIERFEMNLQLQKNL